MKLKFKFSLIIFISVFQISLLSTTLFLNFKGVIKAKDFLYKEQNSLAKLNDYVYSLDRIDFYSLDLNIVYHDFEKKWTNLSASFDDFLTSDFLNKVSSDVVEDPAKISTHWDLLKEDISSFSQDFSTLKDIHIPLSAHNIIDEYGVDAALEHELLADDFVFNKFCNLVDEIYILIDSIHSKSDTLLEDFSEIEGQIIEIASKKEKTAFVLMIVLSILSVFVISALIVIITFNLTNKINKLKSATDTFVNRDFTASIIPEGSYEIKSLMENLNMTINQINDFFVVVKMTTSKAISSGYSINDSANSTAAATAEIDKNIEQITNQFDIIKEAVKKAVQAISQMDVQVDTLVDKNSEQTLAIEDSNKAVKEVVSTLDYINSMAADRAAKAEEMRSLVADGDEKISATANLLQQIESQLDEITEVVTIINAVAEETNLLSMNAAIESAHAGEAGKGFAVVAEEIRSLAEETSENASRISTVINNVVSSVNNANTSSIEASKAFNIVSKHSHDVINSFSEIKTGIVKIDEQMQQIKEKSEETAYVADSINTYCSDLAQKQGLVSVEVKSVNEEFLKTMEAIKHIKKGTENIVTRMKQVSSASKESYKNMTDLENMLEQFKTKVEVNEAVERMDEENAINTVISEDIVGLEAFNEDLFTGSDVAPIESSSDDIIDFDLDNVEEWQPE